ncbi:MAG: hypothetical protein F6K47_38340, partial [Symploca sp. SIO2E6]|nr:hypothetical protein [Symploca sp. SIO2E6]
MSKSKKRIKILQKLIRQIGKLSRLITKQLMQLLLRSLLILGRRSRRATAGFVLPTVVMVSLVVILLTTAIMVRSFDRTRNASNYRVSQAVLNAAEPALERAKRKLKDIFENTTTRGIASENTIDGSLNGDKYTFADETRLQLNFDINDDRSITSNSNDPIVNRETTTNAWRFPVDTDNNGKFDSFTLYSIVFRNPSRNNDGNFNRPRNPLEARTRPMDEGALGGACAAALGTSASLVGDTDWYQSAGVLKKGFFVYVATVPITDTTALGLGTDYENHTGNKGFSALEYQQDRVQIPPSNNAIVYEDDLTIFAGSAFRVNGRIFTNSNLFGLKTYGNIELLQVSSPASCFYKPENSKIVVAGNLVYGRPIDPSSPADVDAQKNFRIDLYKQGAKPVGKIFDATQESVDTNTNGPDDIAYNNAAYEARIAELVKQALAKAPDPQG